MAAFTVMTDDNIDNLSSKLYKIINMVYVTMLGTNDTRTAVVTIIEGNHLEYSFSLFNVLNMTEFDKELFIKSAISKRNKACVEKYMRSNDDMLE